MRTSKTWTQKERDYVLRTFFPSHNPLRYSAEELGKMFQRTTSAIFAKAAEIAREKEDAE